MTRFNPQDIDQLLSIPAAELRQELPDSFWADSEREILRRTVGQTHRRRYRWVAAACICMLAVGSVTLTLLPRTQTPTASVQEIYSVTDETSADELLALQELSESDAFLENF